MPLQRIGAIGDIHAEDARLAAALDFLLGAKADAILAVGDIVDGEGDVERCCELLRAAGVLAVAGNHERWLLSGTLRELPGAHLAEQLSEAARAFLAGLPRTRRLETAAGKLLLCHGVGCDDMARLGPDDYGYALSVNEALQALLREGEIELMVGGHTHRRMVRRLGRLTAINAGTLHREGRPGFCLLDLSAREVLFYDIGAALEVSLAERAPLP